MAINPAINAVGMVLAASLAVPALPEHLPLVAVSGVAGGVVRWIADKTHIWPTGLGTIITGGLVATFVWPVAEPLVEGMIGKVEMEPVTAMLFGGFTTGVLGLSLVGAFLDVVRARRARVGGHDD